MKSILKSLTISVTLLIGLTLFSCNGKEKAVAYQCPMNCQADSLYSNEGNCLVCGMDLNGVEKVDSTNMKIINNSTKN